ncbi:MAG: hypothetical protein RIS47_1380, partial [Bacteroidota bacterium]
GNRLFWLIARDQSDIIRSEKLLTEKDSMFRQIVANMLESVLVCDAVYDNEYRLIDFLIKDANFAFENLSGMDKKTFIGKQGLDFWPKMDSVWFEKAAIVLRTGKPQLFDQFFRSWNKYLRVTLYSPGPDKIVLVISDVSDSVRAEIELRDRERELNAIFENSPLLMILLDENRNVLKINKPRSSLGRFQKGMVVERLLGNALNCLNIHKYKNVCAQGDACKDCKIADIYGNVLESKSSFEYHETDFWMITDYGPLKISLQLNASFFLQGGLNRVLLVINDVTDLKKIGSALQESEKRYKLLSNLTREGVVVAFQQVVVDVNRAFEQMTGIPKTQLIGKNTSDLFDGLPEKSYSLSDPDRDLGIIEVEVFRHDATTFPAEIGMFAYKYNGEDLRVTTVYDLTHKKEAVLNITKAAVEAEEHERMRLARELHDGIGPLLSTAKIYIDALRGATTEVRRVDAIARLKDTIEESLVGIREVSNRISPHVLKNFGLEVAIETFISKLNVMPNLQIGFRSTLYLRSQMYIETTIFRIVTELLVNSLKHAQATEIQVVLGVEASDIILAYTDNGVGFDLNAHTHGMGLFNIRARVQNFNGRIFFETSKGTGLKVRLAIKYEAATKDTIL